jgi:hypothetical protein
MHLEVATILVWRKSCLHQRESGNDTNQERELKKYFFSLKLSVDLFASPPSLARRLKTVSISQKDIKKSSLPLTKVCRPWC